MKRQLICMVLSTSLVFSGAVVAFADQTGTPTSSTLISSMTYTGTPIKLSLEEAIKVMQTEGLAAQNAEIQKKNDEAIAKKYKENASSIKDSLNDGDGTSTVIDRDEAKLKRDFAAANVENNYQAAMNGIANNTISAYYGVLLAQDQMKAAEDNLKIQQELLAKEQKKYTLGLTSKISLSSAEHAVMDAANTVNKSRVDLDNAKMGFNISMDYPIMQSVVLTDTLKEVSAPTVGIEDAVKKGLESRMEIKQATLLLDVQKAQLDHLSYIMSKNSSSYLQAQKGYTQLQMAASIAPKQIEQDIRTKYMNVLAKKSALDSAKAAKTLADESYRLAMISYEAGMNTITDVQDAQLKAFQANQGVSAAVMEYDLAVYAYEFSQTVGTEPISL